MAKKEKPAPITPVPCICGREAVIVKMRLKKMVSCPDPLNCCCNPRTMWQKAEDVAVAEWNTLILQLKFKA